LSVAQSTTTLERRVASNLCPRLLGVAAAPAQLNRVELGLNGRRPGPAKFVAAVREGRVKPVVLAGGVRAFRPEEVDALRAPAKK
jgi:hypothetical protein